MWCDGEEPVDQPDPWDGRKEDKPEVEEHIDLETATVTQKSWWWITILYQRQKGWSWLIIIMVFKICCWQWCWCSGSPSRWWCSRGEHKGRHASAGIRTDQTFGRYISQPGEDHNIKDSFNLLLSWTPAMTWLSTITLLTLGKTLLRGSSRTLIGSSICVRTSLRER